MGSGFRHDGPEVASAARFGLAAAVLGVLVVILAAALTRGCDGAVVDSVSCGRPQRLVLALAAPVILFCAAVYAFVRTYRAWKSRQTWWAWQGAGWFLMLVMITVLTMSLPVLAGFGG